MKATFIIILLMVTLGVDLKIIILILGSKFLIVMQPQLQQQHKMRNLPRMENVVYLQLNRQHLMIKVIYGQMVVKLNMQRLLAQAVIMLQQTENKLQQMILQLMQRKQLLIKTLKKVYNFDLQKQIQLLQINQLPQLVIIVQQEQIHIINEIQLFQFIMKHILIIIIVISENQQTVHILGLVQFMIKLQRKIRLIVVRQRLQLNLLKLIMLSLSKQ